MMHDLNEDHSEPLFRQTEFRELRAPLIDLPRRNYQPCDGFVTMFATNPGAAALGKPTSTAVDLTPTDMARGRASSLAKRTHPGWERANARRGAASTRQQIVDLLRERAPAALSSKDIAETLGVDRLHVSDRLNKHRRLFGEIEVIHQPKTALRLYRWTGEAPQP